MTRLYGMAFADSGYGKKKCSRCKNWLFTKFVHSLSQKEREKDEANKNIVAMVGECRHQNPSVHILPSSAFRKDPRHVPYNMFPSTTEYCNCSKFEKREKRYTMHDLSKHFSCPSCNKPLEFEILPIGTKDFDRIGDDYIYNSAFFVRCLKCERIMRIERDAGGNELNDWSHWSPDSIKAIYLLSAENLIQNDVDLSEENKVDKEKYLNNSEEE